MATPIYCGWGTTLLQINCNIASNVVNVVIWCEELFWEGLVKTYSIVFVGLIFISHCLYALQLNGQGLFPASESALAEAAMEVDKDSIFAWESELEQGEVVVRILNEDGVQLSYGCHHHGPHMSCHEESINQGHQHYHKDSAVTLDFVKSGHRAALAKFEKTLQRQGKGLSVMSLLKVWVHEDGHGENGHEHGPDVWTKINYSLNGSHRTIFILCHTHGHDRDFSCHYRNSGEGGPNLSF